MHLDDDHKEAINGRRLFHSQLGVIDDWVNMHELSTLGGHS
jgi:hypothetical protein